MSRKPSPRGHPMSVIGSIKTNVAANTALLNLENTVTSLQNTQSEISTGLAVSSAKDNASYFSIATVLRSDSSALSNVSDTLNLGDSSLSVASTALAKISTTLSDIKNQLVSATAPGADMKVISAADHPGSSSAEGRCSVRELQWAEFSFNQLEPRNLQFHEEFRIVLFARLNRGDLDWVHQYRHQPDRAVRCQQRRL